LSIRNNWKCISQLQKTHSLGAVSFSVGSKNWPSLNSLQIPLSSGQMVPSCSRSDRKSKDSKERGLEPSTFQGTWVRTTITAAVDVMPNDPEPPSARWKSIACPLLLPKVDVQWNTPLAGCRPTSGPASQLKPLVPLVKKPLFQACWNSTKLGTRQLENCAACADAVCKAGASARYISARSALRCDLGGSEIA